MRGTVDRFDVAVGTGSITAGDVPERFVVHRGEIRGSGELRPGQQVSFDAVVTKHGLRATNVVPGRERTDPKMVYTVGGFAVAALVALLYVVGFGVHWITGWLLAINVVIIGYYSWDKGVAEANAAERTRAKRVSRVPETTLHLLALGGGSIGGVLARRILRHKIAKRSFLVRAWLIIAVQAVLVADYVRRFGTELP